jgi:hypothetical protein
MMMKSGIEFFALELLLPKKAELAWQVSLKGLGEFQNKKF